jgi:ABC-type dipeptide/oligopeptide/nickel transport system ATPase component
MNKKKVLGVVVSLIISILTAIYVDFMPDLIRSKLTSLFNNYPNLWVGGIVFVFLLFLIIIIPIKHGKRVSAKETEKKEQDRKLFIHSLERRYQQKLIQKTDERFSPPMEFIYTKEGINEGYTIFLDDEAKTEAEIREGLAVLLNKHRQLLIIGQAGSGKTVRLHEMALGLLKNASDDATKPIPVILNLATWTEDYNKLDEWLIDYLIKTYNFPPNEDVIEFMEGNNMIPLFDGFDEIGYYFDDENEKNKLRERCLSAIHDYRNLRNNPMFVICSRTAEYVNADGNMAVNAQLKLKNLEEQKIIRILDEIIHAPNNGIFANSNDNVARNLKAHINKNPVLLKVLCVPFYFNALFQVLNRLKDEVKIDFPQDETKIKNFIVELFIKRKIGREDTDDIGIWGRYLCWLARWTRKKKKITFNLTDFDTSCLYNSKFFKVIGVFLEGSPGIFLFLYLFAGLPVVWCIIASFAFFVLALLGGGLKDEKEEKTIIENVIKEAKEIKRDRENKSEDHWIRWKHAAAFASITGVYITLAFGILKGLLCAFITVIVYRYLVPYIRAWSPSTDYNFKIHRREKHSRKDELKKWDWKALFRFGFWGNVIYGMYMCSLAISLIFALLVKIFGTDWKTGLFMGTILGLAYGFWTSIQSAYKIKYYADKADKPLKRLSRDFFVEITVNGLSFFTAKYFICIYLGETVHSSLYAALTAGAFGIAMALLQTLFLKYIVISLILAIERKLPFLMNILFNRCVESRIFEYENSSWKFSHQILIQFFIDTFAKPKCIKNIEESYHIQLKEAEYGGIWENENTYKLNQYGDVTGLNLSNNGIEKIVNISALKKLQELNLSNNNISEIQFWSFHDSVPLKRIFILDLSQNRISKIGGLVELTGLRVLDLSGNLIKDISCVPSTFKEMERLILRDNCISKIPSIDEFLKMKHFHNLDIDGNPADMQDGIDEIIDKTSERYEHISFLIKGIIALWLKHPFSIKEIMKSDEEYYDYLNKKNRNQ